MKLQLLILLIGLTSIEADTKNDSKNSAEKEDLIFLNKTARVPADVVHSLGRFHHKLNSVEFTRFLRDYERKFYTLLGFNVTDEFIANAEKEFVKYAKILDREDVQKNLFNIGIGGRPEYFRGEKLNDYTVTDAISTIIHLNLRVFDLNDEKIMANFDVIYKRLLKRSSEVFDRHETYLDYFNRRVFEYAQYLYKVMTDGSPLEKIHPGLESLELESRKNIQRAHLKTFTNCCQKCIDVIGRCCDYCSLSVEVNE